MASNGILRRIGAVFSIDVDKNSQKETEKTLDGIKSYAKKALGLIAIGISVKNTAAIVKEFSAVNATIKRETAALGDQAQIQKQIMESANKTNMSYADTAETITNMVKTNGTLFGNIEDAVKFNNSATMLLKTAGKTDDEVNNIMDSMMESMKKGTVDAGMLNTLISEAPDAVKLLADQYKVSEKQLQQMCDSGKVSASALKAAFLDNADQIAKKYEESGITITDAVKNIRNQWGLFTSQIWDGAEVSNRVGKMMVRAFSEFMRFLNKIQPVITSGLTRALDWLEKIADFIVRTGSFLGRMMEKVGGVENALKIAAIAAAALWIAFHAKDIKKFLKDVPGLLKKVFSPGGLKTAAIAAAIFLMILAVEDFINFLQGNDSLIGLFFDKIGIGADNAREAIFEAFGKVKELISKTFETIRQKIIAIWGTIQGYLKDHGEEIRNMFSAIWDAITQIVTTAIRLIGAVIKVFVAVAKGIFSNLSAFWNRWGNDIKSFLGSVFSTAFETIIEIITEAAEVISALFSGDFKGAFDSLSGILDTVSEAFSGITNCISANKEAFELLAIAVGTITALIVAYNAASIAAAIVSGGETAAIMAMYAADGVAAVAKGALTAATGLWTTVAGIATTVTSGLGAAIAFLTSPIGLVILAIGALIAIGVLLYNHWNEIKETAGALWSSVSNAFNSGIEKIKGFITDVIVFVQNNWQSLLLLLVNPIAGAFALLYDNCDGFREFVNSFVDGVKNLWISGWNTIKSFFTETWNSMLSGATERIAKIKDTIVNGINAATSFIKGLPSQALQWGRDFIDGLKKGIEEKVEGVVNAVKGVGEKIRSFLHFSRPDEGPLQDYETWMPDFMSGLSGGIESNSSDVIDKVRKAASAIKKEMMIDVPNMGLNYDLPGTIQKLSDGLKAIKPKLSLAVSNAAVALSVKPSVRTTQNSIGINKAGNTVQQNIEINNTVKTSDQQAGKQAAKQIDKSSKDITKEVQRGLAYGRA